MKTSRRLKHFLTAIGVMACLSSQALTYTVINTFNSGAGSLRQAILDANARPGPDVIVFAIPTAGNTFESSGGNSWAVIQVSSALPIITDAVIIDGTTQFDTNTGFVTGRTVGVDGIVQANINYPDVYIVPSSSFTFPSGSGSPIGVTGNGFTINAVDVTIRGLAISGFGNTNTNSSSASQHADILITRPAANRDVNVNINNNFLSCDPRGAFPSLSRRRTKGNSFLACGRDDGGRIANNYIAYSGTYAIHFNGISDPTDADGNADCMGSVNWTIQDNMILNGGTNTTITTTTRSADAINTMKCSNFQIIQNYIENPEQVGVDLGYNADNNYVANNTFTGYANTTGVAPSCGIRSSLNTSGNTIIKNHIHNNTLATFRAGIWIDRSSITSAGVIVKNNSDNIIQENHIHNNVGSGVVISNNGGTTVNAINNLITRNSIYSNTGLGIDLGGSSSTSSPLVTVNDDGDGDNGPNNLQNFPLIDSAKFSGSDYVIIWGKAPAGSTLEFFTSDGESNGHGGLGLNYGEGQTYIGTGVEGSVSDRASGTGSYNIDGNVATNNVNLFRFTFYSPTFFNTDAITATATVGNNTSEFGPRTFVNITLGCILFDFTGSLSNNKLYFNWSAMCDDKFSYFMVEESMDGRNFSALGSVRTITFNQQEAYNFSAAKIKSGAGYYRLKMINQDGSATYSRVLKLGSDAASGAIIKVTPNPVTDHFIAQVTLQQAADVKMQLATSAGTQVLQKSFRGNKGSNAFMVDQLGALPKGAYIVQFLIDGKMFSETIIKN